MTDEVQKVEVDEMNRPTLPSRCHAVRIDRAVLLHVTESRQTIVMEIARTTIVVIEIDEDVAIIDATDQDDPDDDGDEPSNDSASDNNELVRSRKRLCIKLQKFDGNLGGNLGGHTFRIVRRTI